MMYPGRIVSYDHSNQTASVTISAEYIFSDIDGLQQTGVRATLEGVPVHTPSGGGWAITFDIKEGDSCLVMLSAVGYDHWLYADRDEAGTIAGQPAPQLQRSFCESDGFAIVGMNTIPRAITNLNKDGSEWRNADSTQSIHLKSDGSIQATSPVSITVEAPEIALKGNVTITGNLGVSGDAVASGISLVGHVHGSGPAPS